MKKLILFPALLTVCSVISAIVYQSSFTYFNLFLSVVLLSIVLFSKNKAGRNRIKFSALWLIILELVAFVLSWVGVNIYHPPLVWLMYVVFIAIEIFVTPRIDKKQ